MRIITYCIIPIHPKSSHRSLPVHPSCGATRLSSKHRCAIHPLITYDETRATRNYTPTRWPSVHPLIHQPFRFRHGRKSEQGSHCHFPAHPISWPLRGASSRPESRAANCGLAGTRRRAGPARGNDPTVGGGHELTTSRLVFPSACAALHAWSKRVMNASDSSGAEGSFPARLCVPLL